MKDFTIPFVGLKIGEHTFKFEIKKEFFEHFEYDEFNGVKVVADVLLNKKTTLLEFTLTFEGKVNVNCDITNESYDQDVSGTYHFIVKFGDELNNENEDILIIPHGSYEVNIQQFIYESIVLGMPTRRIHPGVEDGSLKSDILGRLEELSIKKADEDSLESDSTDPRWDKLKKLLTDK